jgi:hypothetical protein
MLLKNWEILKYSRYRMAISWKNVSTTGFKSLLESLKLQRHCITWNVSSWYPTGIKWFCIQNMCIWASLVFRISSATLATIVVQQLKTRKYVFNFDPHWSFLSKPKRFTHELGFSQHIKICCMYSERVLIVRHCLEIGQTIKEIKYSKNLK